MRDSRRGSLMGATTPRLSIHRHPSPANTSAAARWPGIAYARHGNELMGCESAVGVTVLFFGSTVTTRRRQGHADLFETALNALFHFLFVTALQY